MNDFVHVRSKPHSFDGSPRAFGARPGGFDERGGDRGSVRNCEEDIVLLLSASQVAAMLGMGERTLWRFVSEGKFPKPPIRVGAKYVRWERSAVQAWIREQTDGGAA